MQSIFLNLISNAIKYRSHELPFQINVWSEVTENAILLHFKDNGLGIDLKRHGHKLFGLNKTFHRHSESKGVGLFIIKAQIESLGGSITAKSEINLGTTFTLTF